MDDIGTFVSLYQNVCYDCLLLDENAETCDDKGPLSCQAGFYLDIDEETGLGKCQWC